MATCRYSLNIPKVLGYQTAKEGDEDLIVFSALDIVAFLTSKVYSHTFFQFIIFSHQSPEDRMAARIIIPAVQIRKLKIKECDQPKVSQLIYSGTDTSSSSPTAVAPHAYMTLPWSTSA